MSNDTIYLALRLEGPLQAWGYDSQFNRRRTGLFPTKSAVLGMCCAALGIPRGSEREAAMLARMRNLQFLAAAVPRRNRHYADQDPLPVRRLVDYHTVQKTLTAEGKIKDTHLTWRHYLCDAAFAAVLGGDRELIAELGTAVKNPRWGVWLGRKACIPSAPIYAGIHESEESALRELIGGVPLERLSYQREVARFEDGTDTLPDQPLCFGGSYRPRSFAPRRVRLSEGLK
jgi:CRISPR system Cascade subunit CasD